MTAARILLVTGSRVLVGSPSEATAKAVLSAVAEAFAPSVVVAGDARGPDDWAASWVDNTARAALRIYSIDNWVYSERRKRVRQWSSEPEKSFLSPLARNVAMVREVARQRDRGAVVLVLGLEAKWSDTQGTAHTLAAARAQGFEVTRVTFEAAK